MMHPDVDAELVRCLLREQFPRWADQVLTPVVPAGWDNRTFRVGEDLSARLPSSDSYVSAVAKEHRWLPHLAPQLPLSIPTPLALGRPGCGYPWPWSLYSWLPGLPAQADRVEDMTGFALALAGFLAALQKADVAGGPIAGPHSFGRGGPLSIYDEQTRAAAQSRGDAIDPAAALEVWEAAVADPYKGEPVWVHGDMTPSNLLVERGRLTAVIDFGTCAVGDPACDLVIAWTFLRGESRQRFREALAVDRAAWVRARGWALWKALLTLADRATEAAAVRRYGWRLHAKELIHELVKEHRDEF